MTPPSRRMAAACRIRRGCGCVGWTVKNWAIGMIGGAVAATALFGYIIAQNIDSSGYNARAR